MQRKEFPNDFLASVHDGRLNLQISQMQQLDVKVLLLEGREHWTSDGKLIRERNDKRNGWSRTQHRNYLASVQMRGITVLHTDSLTDTISYLDQLCMWCNKDDHSSLYVRGAAKGDAWGNLSNRDYAIWFLQGLPGIGPKQAALIFDTVGVPFTLTVPKEALLLIPGMGKGRVDKIIKMLQSNRRQE